MGLPTEGRADVANKAGGQSASRTRVFPLTIGKVPGAKIEEIEVDALFAQATHVLQEKDSERDIPANVSFSRVGEVVNVRGPAVVNTQADYDALARLGKNIVVVKGINYCGGTFVPKVVGCAAPGQFMAVVRRNIMEGLLWAHEFGHVCGLIHRDSSAALMHPSINPRHRILSPAEAKGFERGPARIGVRSMAALEATPPPTYDALPFEDPEDYLSRIFPHGIAYKQVEKFSNKDVARMIAGLWTPNALEDRGNAIVALAAIATPESLNAVFNFIHHGELSGAADCDQVRRAAVMSLGYAIQKIGTSEDPESQTLRARVLHELRELACSPAPLQQVSLEGGAVLPSKSASGEKADTLAASALAGLALSGAPEASLWFDEAIWASGGGEIRFNQLVEAAKQQYARVKLIGVRSYTDRKKCCE